MSFFNIYIVLLAEKTVYPVFIFDAFYMDFNRLWLYDKYYK